MSRGPAGLVAALALLLGGCLVRDFDESSPLWASDAVAEAEVGSEPDTVVVGPDQGRSHPDADTSPDAGPCGAGCDDEDPCTVDQCGATGCEHEPACDDGVLCTQDSCGLDGVCLHAADNGMCATGSLCVLQQCHPELGCVPLAEVDCDDGNACNGKESCDPLTGECKAGFPSGCAVEDDNVCNGISVCNPQTGGCDVLPPPECPKGNLCAGLWACNPKLGCVLDDPQPCEDADGNPCNGTVQCNPATGACEPATFDCEQGDLPECVGVLGCDPVLGCVLQESGLECCAKDEDCQVNACFPATCQDSKCVPAPPLECDDGNPCNGPEACDPEVGCVSTGAPLDCDDGNPCNGTAVCDPTKGCLPTPPGGCDDGNLCNGAETCDPETGCEAGAPVTCDDGNVCDGLESCHPDTGCVPGVPLACDDGHPCNGLEHCDQKTGCAVSGGPLSGCCTANNSCDDDNVCNGAWSCDTSTGSCVLEVAPPSCSDDDPCTVDWCEPDKGCLHAPTPGCGG